MQLHHINCVILCGGKSSRMGQDKSKLLLKNQNLTQFQVEKFSKIFKNVYLSAKEDKFENTFKIIQDSSQFSLYSPMLALYSILSYFNNEYIFIISVDTPKLSQNELIKMATFLDQNYQIIIAKTPLYKHPLCGFYHTTLAQTCKKLLEQNQQKLGFLLAQARTKLVEFDNENAFLNLNFYEEYEKFKNELS
ncbi:molybdenum cofactor guanylyltransferase [Campylobacter hepaticus]|uniref:Probable molybdenum cofactor guanylyltransferase n=1 Tax=Campylobacter hepaticus TaxID=1813019 RepID=A0A6A7JQQ5_9BACT|nr:molybdenum cofactor guanylyltransferase [Campylobacter hepaticus]MCZ0772038.1 molybdenum cofactor guanylyltransferase [Campylobacter hepaticus]MCZ0773507.1 molybdenum cofactor guanylyltransferase [Campylobacter hepaticus]MCZ0774757.1 molybdenum cofactor guanylyltransferase [Campylobacter hepaticus]MDX2322637.1 molybdenum cofactor guanylyltransferase [Campylobacter hepaticus]MDX2330815.1 molybdenum cofactor guanylyltransferase [Campylobacter hepaticus]